MSFLLPIATRVLGGAAAKGGVSRLAAFSLGKMSSKGEDKSQVQPQQAQAPSPTWQDLTRV